MMTKSMFRARSLSRVWFPAMWGAVWLLSMGCLIPGSVQADDAATKLFRECTAELKQLTTRCIQANQREANACIAEIRDLLGQGEERLARAVAARCVDSIEKRTERCQAAIRSLSVRCVNLLRDLGAPRLADEFKKLCDRALDAVEQASNALIREIKSQF